MEKDYIVYAGTEGSLYDNGEIIAVTVKADIRVSFSDDLSKNSPLHEVYITYNDYLYGILVCDIHSIH